MLRKLRIKFVAIIMAAVTLILTAVFAAICVINWQQNTAELDEALAAALDSVAERVERSGDPHDRGPGGKDGWNGEIGRHLNDRDVFYRSGPLVVYLYEGGKFTLVSRSSVRVSDAALARAAELLPATGEASGLLDEYELAWCEEEIGGSTFVAFTEAGFLSDWRRLVLVLVLVEAATLAVFFGVAWAFSRWALRPVERAWNQQRQFVGDAAHDLKTPLTVILANSSILLDEPAMEPPEREKWIRSTQTEAEGMRALVEDMLLTMGGEDEANVAKRPPQESSPGGEGEGAVGEDAGETAGAAADSAVAAEPSGADLSRIVQHEMLQFESVAYERRLTLDGDVREGLHVALTPADARRLVGVLLDNACKYANEGGSVNVGLEESEASARGGRTAVLTVSNTGDPIPAEDLPHLFDRFYRADAARTSRQGHGLGLSIAKALVEAAGGSIAAASNEGLVTFTVVLPLR